MAKISQDGRDAEQCIALFDWGSQWLMKTRFREVDLLDLGARSSALMAKSF
jgi:hypothetical protein